MKALLGALLLLAVTAAQGEVRTFERADSPPPLLWVLPDDTGTSWTEVTLPHNWNRDDPRHSGGPVWYRIRFTLAEPPLRPQSLYFARLPISDLAVYVNRQKIWRQSESYAIGAARSAVLVPIPDELLRKGENVIHLEALGSGWFYGIPRVHLGDSKTLAERAGMRSLIQGQMINMVAAAFGAIGVLALWLWLRGGRDPVLFWYAASGICLFVATALWYLTQWRDDAGASRLALIFLRFNGYLTPLLILHMRLARIKIPWLEAIVWAALIAAVASIGAQGAWQSAAWTGWGILFAALPLLFTLPLLRSPDLRRQPAVILLLVADVIAALINLHDWALRFGWIDFDRPLLVFFVAPFVMLAAAVPILERMLAGAKATAQMNVELERRVAEKAREIEASHDQLRRSQRAQELAGERRRIMADMHDGLGARLVSLLSIVQSGKAKRREISEGIATALDELRLTIDSVQPVEGDVGVVLGNVRHRMRSVFERAGIGFVWNVSALPRMDNLTPERILAIQRIFLEVFSNALKHAGARTVAVSAVRLPGAVRIVIADDGCGFEEGVVRTGNGLANLKLRAAQAG
ncbi:MAG: hypothetical protein ABI423_13965, partial [Burkholderiales bacterium]